MSIAKPATKTKTKPSFGQWFASLWFKHFVFVYCVWVFLFFLAPVFMRIGWNSAGKAIFFINFIFLLLLHGTLLLSLWSKDNVPFE